MNNISDPFSHLEETFRELGSSPSNFQIVKEKYLELEDLKTNKLARCQLNLIEESFKTAASEISELLENYQEQRLKLNKAEQAINNKNRKKTGRVKNRREIESDTKNSTKNSTELNNQLKKTCKRIIKKTNSIFEELLNDIKEIEDNYQAAQEKQQAEKEKQQLEEKKLAFEKKQVCIVKNPQQQNPIPAFTSVGSYKVKIPTALGPELICLHTLKSCAAKWGKSDKTGLAEIFPFKIGATECAKEHMEKRLFIIDLIANFCFKNLEHFEGFCLGGAFKAHTIRTKVPNDEDKKSFHQYENAHISILPQLPLIQVKMNQQQKTYYQAIDKGYMCEINPKLDMSILSPNKKDSAFFKGLTKALQKDDIFMADILNCADLGPWYINAIDSLSEAYDRECIVEELNGIINHDNSVKKATHNVKEKIYQTLTALDDRVRNRKPALPPNGKIAHREAELHKPLEKQLVLAAIAGMLQAIKEC